VWEGASEQVEGEEEVEVWPGSSICSSNTGRREFELRGCGVAGAPGSSTGSWSGMSRFPSPHTRFRRLPMATILRSSLRIPSRTRFVVVLSRLAASLRVHPCWRRFDPHSLSASAFCCLTSLFPVNYLAGNPLGILVNGIAWISWPALQSASSRKLCYWFRTLQLG
jgi:hypothetical protein